MGIQLPPAAAPSAPSLLRITAGRRLREVGGRAIRRRAGVGHAARACHPHGPAPRRQRRVLLHGVGGRASRVAWLRLIGLLSELCQPAPSGGASAVLSRLSSPWRGCRASRPARLFATKASGEAAVGKLLLGAAVGGALALGAGGALATECGGAISADEALKGEDARYAAQTAGDFAAMER